MNEDRQQSTEAVGLISEYVDNFPRTVTQNQIMPMMMTVMMLTVMKNGDEDNNDIDDDADSVDDDSEQL